MLKFLNTMHQALQKMSKERGKQSPVLQSVLTKAQGRELWAFCLLLLSWRQQWTGMKKTAAKKAAVALHVYFDIQQDLNFILKFKGGGGESNHIQILCRWRESLFFGFVWNDIFSSRHPTSINAPFQAENNSAQPLLWKYFSPGTTRLHS